MSIWWAKPYTLTQLQAHVQASVRKRLLRAFVAHGHLESYDAKDINERVASSQHGGDFLVDAGVRIEAVKRTVQLVPPPRTHRHRYYGVLAANSPLRGAVRLRAQVAQLPVSMVADSPVTQDANADADTTGTEVVPDGAGGTAQPEPPPKPKPKPKPKPHPSAHYLCAALIVCIYEVFPLICAKCAGQMRITSVHHPQCRYS